MAAQLINKAIGHVTKQERTRAKPVNFGFLYGSWEKTFIETAWDEYQIEFSMQEARTARRTFFATWRQLEPWHERQRALVRKNGLVTTLFGRVRRLPNIRSSKETMRWHAERQAINAPVQSLGSDITQLAYLEIRDKLKQADLDVRGLGTVHDSLLYEGDETHIAQTLPIIKETMENLPIKRKFGVDITVPLVTNITCSLHWGEGQELTDAEIYDWKGL
jgi:DNA polymerase-1